MTLSQRIGVVEINTLWLFRYLQHKSSFFPQTIRDWNDLPDSLISSAEMSDDCVSKFATLVRSRDYFPPPPPPSEPPGEIMSFGVSPVNYSDSDSALQRGKGAFCLGAIGCVASALSLFFFFFFFFFLDIKRG